MAQQVKNGGAIANAKAQTAQKAPATVKEWVGAYKSQFEKALPDSISPERFTRIALSALSQNPQLQACELQSLLGALMNAAALGLEPNSPLQQAFLIPYKDHGVWKIRFEIGYRGLIDLAYRSGEVKMLQAHVVHENDEFFFEYGLDPKLVHRPAIGNRGAATHVYAVFKLVNGGEGFQVMSLDDVRAHAQRYSKSFDRGPWKTNFEEMSKKTVLKALLKYSPMKSEVVRGMASDDTVQNLRVPDAPGDDLIIEQEVIQVADAADGPAPAADVPPAFFPDEEAPPEH